MVKIIETNLLLDDNNIIQDHQSRVIEDESWENYISMFKNHNNFASGYFKSLVGCLDGYSIPGSGIVENLAYDDFHLTCTVVRQGRISNIYDKKLAYLDRTRT